MQGMDRLWSRAWPGGVVLIDDYGWRDARDQHDAWNHFAQTVSVPILSLPTGQGLMIKGASALLSAAKG